MGLNIGLMLLVFVGMMFMVYKNINAAVAKQKPVEHNTLEESHENIYKTFASYMLSIIDDLKDATKEKKLILKDGVTLEDTEEFYAETIRRAVYFETMVPKNSTDKKHEKHLFTILSDLDTFLEESYEDGENVSDEIREKLQARYMELQG